MKIVVLSSEHKNDNPKTEKLLNLLRENLGFNEDTCQWPFEAHEKHDGESREKLGGNDGQYIYGYIKRTWCCVVHLTDELLKDPIFMQSTVVCVADTLMKQPFPAKLLIIEDISEENQGKIPVNVEHFRGYAKEDYGSIFGEGIGLETKCEKMVRALLP